MEKLRQVSCEERLIRMPESVTGQANTTHFFNKNAKLYITFLLSLLRPVKSYTERGLEVFRLLWRT